MIFARIKLYFSFLTILWFLSLYLIAVALKPQAIIALRKWATRKILSANGITYKVEGELDPTTQLFILNHQSMFDILVLEDIYKGDIAWVAKQELFEIFVMGKSLKISNSIALNREDRKGLKEFLTKVEDLAQRGIVVALFPEGTRSKKGTFLPFKPGAQFVANALKLKVQPIVIGDTSSIFNLSTMQMHKGTIPVTILPSFKIDENTPKTWLEDTRQTMLTIYHGH